jgi:HEAT repeat protein
MSWEQAVADLCGNDVDRALKAGAVIRETADESRVPELYALLENGDLFVREMVADPLAMIEGVRSLPALLGALTRGVREGNDNDGLQVILSDVVEQNADDAAPVLLEMLGDDCTETRANAAWALGYASSVVPADALLQALKDNDSSVKVAAAGSLEGFTGDVCVVDGLIDLLQDPDEQVRTAAVDALGYLGDKRAVPVLEEALKDPSGRVSEFAGYALERLGVRRHSARWPSIREIIRRALR